MEPVLSHLSDVEPSSVDWIWPSRVPRGKLSLLVGDPGLGKSFVTLDIASRVTRGSPWVDGGEAPLGNVVMLSAEDDVADTIRPRIDSLGGDAGRVWVLEAVRVGPEHERSFSLATDLDALRHVIAQVQASLVVIDPLSAYLGGVDSHRDAEIRQVLMPLARLAQDTHAAILGVMHLNKASQLQAIYRTSGSIAFVGTARSVFLIARDPEAQERRLLVPVKMNISEMPPTLSFTLPHGHLLWGENPIYMHPDDVLSGAPVEDREDSAGIEEFFQDMLRHGPLPSTDILRAARENGYSRNMVFTWKKKLGIKAERLSFGSTGQGVWLWSLTSAASV